MIFSGGLTDWRLYNLMVWPFILVCVFGVSGCFSLVMIRVILCCVCMVVALIYCC